MKQIIYMSYVLMIFMATTPSLNAMHFLKTVYRGFDKGYAMILRRGEIPVFMNEAKTITLAPSDQKPTVISTTGLIGCTATVVYVLDETGHKHVILTHFSKSHNAHITTLEQHMKVLALKKLLHIKFITIIPKFSHFFHSKTLDFNDNSQKDYKDYEVSTEKMRTALESVVKENGGCAHITTVHIPYLLPRPRDFLKTDVYVTLNIKENASQCFISNWEKDHFIELE